MNRNILSVIIVTVGLMVVSCTPNGEALDDYPIETTSVIANEDKIEIVTPTPTVTIAQDIPIISKEDMANIIWNKIPAKLSSDYSKTRITNVIKSATYMGNSFWEFSCNGDYITSAILPEVIYEKTPNKWVREQSKQITTRNLLIKITFNDKDNSILSLNVDTVNQTIESEVFISSPAIGKGVDVLWVTWTYNGDNQRIEGSIKNIGVLPLKNVVAYIQQSDGRGKPLDVAPITIAVNADNGGSTIEPGELGHYLVNTTMKTREGWYMYSFTSEGLPIYSE